VHLLPTAQNKTTFEKICAQGFIVVFFTEMFGDPHGMPWRMPW
jgi:hypothetical protein